MITVLAKSCANCTRTPRRSFQTRDSSVCARNVLVRFLYVGLSSTSERRTKECFVGNASGRVSRFSSLNSKIQFRLMWFSLFIFLPRPLAFADHQKFPIKCCRTRDLIPRQLQT